VGFLLGTHDPEVQYAFFRLLQPGMTVYDIGANVGFTALLAAKQVSPGGRVICFEPLASNSDQIARNAELNGFHHLQIYRIALGSSDGEAKFLVSQSPTWGRLAHAGRAPLQSSVMRVPIRSLDSLSASEHLPPPHFVKIDVEGAEPEVILGGKKLLASARPVLVIELHHTYQAVLDALKGLNYNVRPLTRTRAVFTTDGEFQVIAAPCECIEAVLADLTAGNMRIP
jgi:FkbM family methyltransferase